MGRKILVALSCTLAAAAVLVGCTPPPEEPSPPASIAGIGVDTGAGLISPTEVISWHRNTTFAFEAVGDGVYRGTWDSFELGSNPGELITVGTDITGVRFPATGYEDHSISVWTTTAGERCPGTSALVVQFGDEGSFGSTWEICDPVAAAWFG